MVYHHTRVGQATFFWQHEKWPKGSNGRKPLRNRDIDSKHLAWRPPVFRELHKNHQGGLITVCTSLFKFNPEHDQKYPWYEWQRSSIITICWVENQVQFSFSYIALFSNLAILNGDIILIFHFAFWISPYWSSLMWCYLVFNFHSQK